MLRRLNKFIADCGLCSRREADRYIQDGLVCVNGHPVTKLGLLIDPENDRITCKRRVLKPQSNLVYIMINKPKECLSSTKSDQNRTKTVISLLPKGKERLYPIGRLDKDTSGLLLITNDGDLTHQLLHPSQHVEKEYKAVVLGDISESMVERLRQGVELSDGKTSPAGIFWNDRFGRIHKFKIVIHEGRKRQIKRMFQHIGATVVRLNRTKFAGLSLGNLKIGQWRYLKEHEIRHLKKIAEEKK